MPQVDIRVSPLRFFLFLFFGWYFRRHNNYAQSPAPAPRRVPASFAPKNAIAIAQRSLHVMSAGQDLSRQTLGLTGTLTVAGSKPVVFHHHRQSHQ
jgi:hypothetical protein